MQDCMVSLVIFANTDGMQKPAKIFFPKQSGSGKYSFQFNGQIWIGFVVSDTKDCGMQGLGLSCQCLTILQQNLK